MTVNEIIPLGKIRLDHKLCGEIDISSELFGRNYQRYIVNVTTKKVHWGLKREIIDFEGSLPKTHWGVIK